MTSPGHAQGHGGRRYCTRHSSTDTGGVQSGLPAVVAVLEAEGGDSRAVARPAMSVHVRPQVCIFGHVDHAQRGITPLSTWPGAYRGAGV